MKLLKSYRDMLAAMEVFESPNAVLHWLGGNSKEMNDSNILKVSAKLSNQKVTVPVVLPTEEILGREEDYLSVKFNPLAEHMFAKANSEIQTKLNILAAGRFLKMSIQVITDLIALSMKPELHEGLDPDLFEIISKLSTPKRDSTGQKAVDFVNKVLVHASTLRGINSPLRMKIHHNVSNEGKVYHRACTFESHLLNEVFKEKPYGMSPPNKFAAGMLQELVTRTFGYLVNKATAYHEGKEAPTFFAFVKAFKNAGYYFNFVSNMLGSHGAVDNKVDIDWIDDMVKNGYSYYRKELAIPFQGNVGPIVEETDGSDTPRTGAPEVQNGQVAAAHNDPVSRPAPVVQPPVVQTQQVAQPVNTQVKPMMTLNDLANAGTSRTMTRPGAFELNATLTKPSSRPQETAQPALHASHQQSTGGLQIQRAAQPQAHAGGLQVQRTTQSLGADEAYLMDYKNQPLKKIDGSFFIVKKKDVPNFPVGQACNAMRQPEWNQDGTPKLVEVNPNQQAMPGMMPGMMPGAMDPKTMWMQQQRMQQMMPGMMPGVLPGAMPGMMPGMPGVMPGMMPGGYPPGTMMQPGMNGNVMMPQYNPAMMPGVNMLLPPAQQQQFQQPQYNPYPTMMPQANQQMVAVQTPMGMVMMPSNNTVNLAPNAQVHTARPTI